MLNTDDVRVLVDSTWDETIIPTLEEYIRIPNQSPNYDLNWETNKYQDQAVTLFSEWAKAQAVIGMQVEVLTEKGKTPIILIEINPTDDTCNQLPVLMYGHLDKQPPLHGQWFVGLDPYVPVIKDGKLYGRGGADDGYAIFAAITSVRALQVQGVKHGRIVILIEASEESGSPDLPFWLERINHRLGDIGFIICLDSGCGTYDQFWLTTSLRGVIAISLKVQLLNEGVHSGVGTGVVADSFRVIRTLLNRIEDSETGRVLLDELYTEIPPNRVREIQEAAETIGLNLISDFPLVGSAEPVDSDPAVLLRGRTWEPKLAYVGIEGIPDMKGGNVLRPFTTIKLSMRIPPHVNCKIAGEAIVRALSENPPYNALVEAKVLAAANGWEAPAPEPWLEESTNKSSNIFFGKPCRTIGEGGTIPFMNMLGVQFPKAQFLITGLLGPKSNAHGPNEFLHIGMGKGVTCCCSQVLYDYMNK